MAFFEHLTPRADAFATNAGLALPAIGFGTYKAADGGDARVLIEAIRAGYRYFDTASYYGNESYIRDAIAESGVPRADLLVASKLWRADAGYDGALRAFDRSCENLGGAPDLYLIHWPDPDPKVNAATWRALDRLRAEGRVRAIGVSNFLPHHIEALLRECDTVPAVDQLEFHPGHTQEAAAAYCREKGILMQAWSPLGRGRVTGDPLVLRLAAKYAVTPAQLCLRFALQCGVMPVVKASSPERMAENLRLPDFELSRADFIEIETMPDLGWSGEHPDRPRVKPSFEVYKRA